MTVVDKNLTGFLGNGPTADQHRRGLDSGDGPVTEDYRDIVTLQNPHLMHRGLRGGRRYNGNTTDALIHHLQENIGLFADVVLGIADESLMVEFGASFLESTEHPRINTRVDFRGYEGQNI